MTRSIGFAAMLFCIFSCEMIVEHQQEKTKHKIDELTRVAKENTFSVSREDYDKLMQISNDTTLSEGERKLQIRKQNLLILQKGMQKKKRRGQLR